MGASELLFRSASGSALPDLKDTPGIYYAITYMISFIIITHFRPAKRKGWKRILIFLGMGGFLAFYMTVTKNPPLPLFLPIVLGTVVQIFLGFLWLTEMNWKNCLFDTLRAFMLGEFAASLEWQLFYFGLTELKLALNPLTNLIFMLPTYALVFLPAAALERKYDSRSGRYEQLELQGHALLGEILIIGAVYFMSDISFVLQRAPFTARYTSEILLLRTVVDFAGVVVLYFYSIVLHQAQEQMELQTMQNMLQLQYSNYQISRESVDLVNQKYHDLKHQIAVLRDGMDSEEKVRYLDRMEAEIKLYEAQNKTGNEVLDTILTSKAMVCQRYHIEFTIVADGAALSFMSIMDISSLFGNALDNAIEASKQIPNPQERLIHLTIARQKGFVNITLMNRFSGEVRFRNGLPATTKQNRSFHGFGVKSMRSTVEKYGGSLTVKAENGWFTLHILLPGTQSRKEI
ncbi:MAG: ATP-binding protein [Bilifractor sp.]|nr:ATP-binding protein [Lachnospiraceae bacterium]MDY2838200.1 ATP-binding protein [Bilifractor sp.]